MDIAEDRYVRRVWVWDGEARPFTAGPGDSNAKWSPDGTRLAFLRNPGEDPAQLAVMASAGGEAEIVTDFALGVSGFEWSPASDRIAVAATTWTADWAETKSGSANPGGSITPSTGTTTRAGGTIAAPKCGWLIRPEAPTRNGSRKATPTKTPRCGARTGAVSRC